MASGGWDEVLKNLASGAWTLQQAADYLATKGVLLDAKGVLKHLRVLQDLGGKNAELARQICARYVPAAAATTTVAATTTAGTTAAATALRVGLTIVGVGLVAGTLLIGSYAAYKYFTAKPLGSSATQTKPCPSPIPKVREKCPWTPDGVAVEECQQGYCWDGGFQGSLSCKQKDSVPNSRRTDLSVLICNEGYKPERDPCTKVITQCVK